MPQCVSQAFSSGVCFLRGMGTSRSICTAGAGESSHAPDYACVRLCPFSACPVPGPKPAHGDGTRPVLTLLVSQTDAALGAAAGKHLAAVAGGHTLAEAVLLGTLALLGLIGTKHGGHLLK